MDIDRGNLEILYKEMDYSDITLTAECVANSRLSKCEVRSFPKGLQTHIRTLFRRRTVERISLPLSANGNIYTI